MEDEHLLWRMKDTLALFRWKGKKNTPDLSHAVIPVVPWLKWADLILFRFYPQRRVKKFFGWRDFSKMLYLQCWHVMYTHLQCGGWIGCDHMDSKSMQPGATPGLSAILFSSVLAMNGIL